MSARVFHASAASSGETHIFVAARVLHLLTEKLPKHTT
jgi:hypothetical protein